MADELQRQVIASQGNPLARKLSLFVPLSNADRALLDTMTGPEQRFPADVDLIQEGQRPQPVRLLLEGMAMRYRSLPDGGRQIMTFLLPGDLCDAHAFLLDEMDHSIGTITPVRVSSISRDMLMNVFANHPRISATLWWNSLQEEAMLRERIVSLGRRNARGRIAYLLCELFWRYEAIGLSKGGAFQLPLTQLELGDTLGLTPVHVNRILKDFREQHLIATRHKIIELIDIAGLQDISGVDKTYLHLNQANTELAQLFDNLEAVRADKSK